MLLGFVNRAVDYLEKHMDDQDDSRIAQLKNIDLNNLKSELRKDLGSSLGTMNSTVDTLLKAGQDSFDRFIDVPQKEKINNDIDKLFNVKLDSEDNSFVDDQSSLEELLNFYDLGDDMLLDVDKFDHRFSSRQYDPSRIRNNVVDEEKLERDFENFVGHTPRSNKDVLELQNDFEKFVASDLTKRKNRDFDEYVYIKDDNNTPDFANHNRRLSNPGIMEDPVIPAARRQVNEEPSFTMSEEDSKLLDLIARNVERNQVRSSFEDNYRPGNKNESLDDVFSDVVSNESVDDDISLDQIVDDETVENLIDYASDDDSVTPVDKNDIIKLLQDMDVANQKNYYDDYQIDAENDIYSEDILPIQETYQNIQQQPGFVNSLIDDLRTKMIEEDEKRQAIEEEYAKVFDRIHKSYPYLSSGFIRSVYELKDSIANEYPYNTKIIVLHRLVFKEVEYLRQFVEIALSHNFSINADEDKMIVDVFKEYINTDGKIITSIFDVSNQAALLGGEYDGYRVLFTQKVQ